MKKINCKKYRYFIHSCVTIILLVVLGLTVKLGTDILRRCLEEFSTPFFIIGINYTIVFILNVFMIFEIIAGYKKLRKTK